MFFFIDVYSNTMLENESQRKKLIDKIYREIDNTKESSDTIKFRAVLLYYSNYFEQKENIDVLEKIMAYFVLMLDHWSRESVESKILSIF